MYFPVAKREFGLLKVKARLGKSIEVADVIVVEVGDDDVFDVGGAHPQELERVNRIAQIGALALRRHFLGESAVDDEAALVADREPAEVIHGHRPVMRIAADEIVLSAALAGRIAQRINLIARKVVIVRHGSRALCSLRPIRLGGSGYAAPALAAGARASCIKAPTSVLRSRSSTAASRALAASAPIALAAAARNRRRMRSRSAGMTS